MRSVNEREKALKLYFGEGKSHRAVAVELGIPRDTVKSWTRRYRMNNGLPDRSRTHETEHIQTDLVRVERKYKPREKSAQASAEERIAQLEMEVDLLKNFLLEKERRLIKR
jgi:transposase